MRYKYIATIALVAITIIAMPVITAQSGADVSLDAPSETTAGESFTVAADGSLNDDVEADITVKLFRLDTGATVCEDTAAAPGTASCSASITADDDVTLRAYVKVGGRIVDDTRHTVTITEDERPPPDDTPTPDPTPAPTPPDDGSEAPDITVNETTGVTEDDPGILGSVIQGFTDAGKNGILDILKTFVLNPFLFLVNALVQEAATILVWTPDVTGNSAVSDIHKLSLTVTFGFAALALTGIGLLYQLGPVFGISYQEVRVLIPRLAVALAFGVISLPLLQLTVELTNTLIIAFKPGFDDIGIGSMVGTGVGLLLVVIIDALLLLAVIIVYLVRDVYLLFIASISPLIALAWALPRTRRYAAAFIGGWWTALAMAPLGMLVLRFVFALMNSSGGAGAQIANWLYGIAGFTLLLFIPYQLYGASQALTMQGFQTAGTLKQRTITRYRQTQRTRDDARTRQSSMDGDQPINAGENSETDTPDWFREDVFTDDDTP